MHSAFEVDFTKVDEIRKAKKADYEKAGGKLTYMSFITKAVREALQGRAGRERVGRRQRHPLSRKTSTSASRSRSTGASSCRSSRTPTR